MKITVKNERNISILALAILMLAATTLVQTYRISKLTKEVNSIKETQVKTSEYQYQVDQSLLRAIIEVESNNNPMAHNSATGATGSAQLTKIVYSGFCKMTKEEAFEHDKNIRCADRFLAYLIKLYKGNEDKAILHYNSGYSKINAKYLIKVRRIQNSKKFSGVKI